MHDRIIIVDSGHFDAGTLAKRLAGEDRSINVAADPDAVIEALRAGDLAAVIVDPRSWPLMPAPTLAALLEAQPIWSDPWFVLVAPAAMPPVLDRQDGDPQGEDLQSDIATIVAVTLDDKLAALSVAVRSALRARRRLRFGAAAAHGTQGAHYRDLMFADTPPEHWDAALPLMPTPPSDDPPASGIDDLYRFAIESRSQVLWSADAQGMLLKVDQRYQTLTGVAVDVGETVAWHRDAHPDDVEPVRAAWAAAMRDKRAFQVEYRLHMADGQYRWHRNSAAPRLSDDGKVVQWYGMLDDIDDRRRAELRLEQIHGELIHVSRVSAMGVMASTLAHEINQPLSAITNFLRGSLRLLDREEAIDHSQIRQALIKADHSALRAGEIIRRLRDMVSRSDVNRASHKLSEIIEESCGLALLDAPIFGIVLKADLNDAEVIIDVDKIQIQQVIINLLRNAIDATKDSSRREIEIKSAINGNYCEISIRDSGPGIPATIIDKLFEPFNSTKRNGMGLGLSISRTIIEAHRGTISCANVPDSGAEFRFSLPLCLDNSTP